MCWCTPFILPFEGLKPDRCEFGVSLDYRVRNEFLFKGEEGKEKEEEEVKKYTTHVENVCNNRQFACNHTKLLGNFNSTVHI